MRTAHSTFTFTSLRKQNTKTPSEAYYYYFVGKFFTRTILRPIETINFPLPLHMRCATVCTLTLPLQLHNINNDNNSNKWWNRIATKMDKFAVAVFVRKLEYVPLLQNESTLRDSILSELQMRTLLLASNGHTATRWICLCARVQYAVHCWQKFKCEMCMAVCRWKTVRQNNTTQTSSIVLSEFLECDIGISLAVISTSGGNIYAKQIL